MMDAFDMIVHRFPAGHDITIIPVADIHLGARESMVKEFQAFINYVKEAPNVYLILVGDLIDNGIKSAVTSVYTETMMPGQQKRMMAELLKPVKDRILCGVCGNHERRSSKEVDDDASYDIMSKCDIEHLYREDMAIIKIQMGERNRPSGTAKMGKDRPSYVIGVTHGAAGGALTGGAINRNERFAYSFSGLDMLITGHTHKPAHTVPSQLVIDPRNNKVTLRPIHVVTATSWLAPGGYSLQKMFSPVSHVSQRIILSGDHKEIDVRTST